MMFNRCLVAVSACCVIGSGAWTQLWAAPPPPSDLRKDSKPLTASLDEMYDALVSRRAQKITRLHVYAAAGQFPVNTDFPGELVPYFVSRDGTACAVGHLVRLDGGRSLVEVIAAKCNHIRIADVDHGPLLDWIRDSGLTQAECALIQPSYATIEDYRRGSQWQEEQARLRKHFDEVEETLRTQSERSLGEALIVKVDAELDRDPHRAAFNSIALTHALESDEPNVRMAAAYAISRLTSNKVNRAERIAALEPHLADPDARVRFWSAVALEHIGSASSRGAAELHRLTLPVFLETMQGGQADIRLPALVQLASVTPECIGTNRQLRIVPDIRHAVVDACSDKDGDIRDFARKVMSTWRWQRIAYESQRMRRHYLSESHEMESLAAETLAMGREFSEPPASVKELLEHRSLYDVGASHAYLLPVGGRTAVPTAETESQATQLVDDYFRTTYAQWLKEGNPPDWKIDSVNSSRSGLYFAVIAWRPSVGDGSKMVFIIPQPSMLMTASAAPGDWFETVPPTNQYAWLAASPSMIQTRPDVHVVLGEAARGNPRAFESTCDLLAHFMSFYALVVVDRDVQVSVDAMTWSGTFARLLQHKPRFFEQGGGGSSAAGGGGWDFYRLMMVCDRATGVLKFSVEPISFPVVQLPVEALTPPWVTEELRLMGWKPMKVIDIFGDMLLPPEYSQAAEVFDPNELVGPVRRHPATASRILTRRWSIEKSLPRPNLVKALLFDKAGRRDDAIKWMERTAAEGENEPDTLADVARWELSVDNRASARAHAEAALKLWPGHPIAKVVLDELASVGEEAK